MVDIARHTVGTEGARVSAYYSPTNGCSMCIWHYCAVALGFGKSTWIAFGGLTRWKSCFVRLCDACGGTPGFTVMVMS